MSKFDDVTRQIKAQLGLALGRIKPWNGGGSPMPKRATGEFYQGINVILLWLRGRTSPTWMTYRQAAQLGGQVKRGEKGTGVCFSAPVTTEEKRPITSINGTRSSTWIRSMACRSNTIRSRCRSLSTQINASCVQTKSSLAQARISSTASLAHTMCRPLTTSTCRSSTSSARTRLLQHHVPRACALDRTQVPPQPQVLTQQNRLRHRLVAEIGSAFMMAHLGLEATVREDHASYLSHWLQALDNDSKFIFSAAAAASRAVTHITAKQAVAEAA